MLDMTKLASIRKAFAASTMHPQAVGMVLVTGPTGSGKTNTLYSALSQLNQRA